MMNKADKLKHEHSKAFFFFNLQEMLKRTARSTIVLLAVKARPKHVTGSEQHTVAGVSVRQAPSGLLPACFQNVFTKASSKKEHVLIALPAGDMRQ